MPKPTIFEILDRYQIDPMSVTKMSDNGFDIRITYLVNGEKQELLVIYKQRTEL